MFPFELNILRYLESIRTPILNTIFESITILGEEVLLIVLMAVLYFCFDKQLARKIFFITAVSIGVNSVIKNFVRLPRPFAADKVSCVRPETATGYSFPSGHTQNFATWSSCFAHKHKKPLLTAIISILIVLMAFSRMYLGAHYPSDVVVGALLGVMFGVCGSILFDRIQNKTVLYTITFGLLTPFAIFYLCKADAQFADFFKFYGLLGGFICATIFEEKFVSLDSNISAFKKVLRVVIGVLLAVLLKEGLKKLFACDALIPELIFAALRYFMLAVVLLGLCPWLFKKLHM